ncbi:uncharacterized protein LOC134542386 isoform X2 [Bacillus rossius redtenbacheri]|uniref:uncharacterized protein LOC134542386 isoform X2 n=1 Tax=Bacillus rossius redtenbacheri TaxID=93214 RepID=UPI002FDC81E9
MMDLSDSFFLKQSIVLKNDSKTLVLHGNILYRKYGRRVADDDLPWVLDFLRRRRDYRGLSLAYNRLSDDGLGAIALFLAEHRHVSSLNVMCNKITCRGVLRLAELGADMPLQSLRVNGNQIGPEGGRGLARLATQCPALEHLDVAETDQSLGSLELLASVLHRGDCSLGLLDLSAPLGPAGHVFDSRQFADSLASALQVNTSLRELHVQKCRLGCHDVQLLAAGLARNGSLLLLDLCCNLVADDGAEHLASVLRRGPPLRGLLLAHNRVSDAGARNLSHGVPYSKLWLLDLAHNRLTDDGVLSILHTLKKAFYSRALYLWGNSITHVSLKVMKRMLRSKVLHQDFLDVRIYSVDGVDQAAYNHVDRSCVLYYCVSDPRGDPAAALKEAVPTRVVYLEEQGLLPARLGPASLGDTPPLSPCISRA